MISANQGPPAGYRVMRVVVIVLGVLMILMFAAVVVGFFYKMRPPAPTATASEGAVNFALAPGAHILSQETSGDRLILHVKTQDGDEVDIVDIESGRLVSRIKAAPAK